MFGRIDDTRYQTGLRKAKNVVVKPHGPVVMRPGLRFVNEVRSSANRVRLIPFKYSLTQSLAVELGNQYIRFHSNGATLSNVGVPALQRFTGLVFTNGSASITVGAHAFAANDKVRFDIGVAGFVANQIYYVSGTGSTWVTLKSEISSTTPINANATIGSSTAYIGKDYEIGEIVAYSGYKYCAQVALSASDAAKLPSASPSPGTNANWYYINSTYIEIPSPYSDTEVFDITYVQSNDVITLCHPSHAPRELRRYSSNRYALVASQFATPVAAPQTVEISANRGQKIRITAANTGNPCTVTVATPFTNQLAVGEPFYIDEVVGMTQLNNRFYTALDFPSANSVRIRNYDGQDWVNASSYTAYSSGGMLQVASPLSDITSRYRVTAFSQDLVESDPSDIKSATNNLNINGSYNTLSWFPVTGVARYNVYKEQNGLYGYIGQVDAKPDKLSSTVASWSNVGSFANKVVISLPALDSFGVGDAIKFTGSLPTPLTIGVVYFVISKAEVSGVGTLTLSDTPTGSAITFGTYPSIGSTATLSRHFAFVDDNIAPDMSKSPPIRDIGLFASTNNYPRAVTYFEQRKCFGGTLTDPQTIWMTKNSTESDMSYSLPTQDNDRIKFKLAARDANVVRHLVPMDSLLMLTNSAEWRITSVNSDAITPTSISVRPQSYVGSNNVQPWVINNSIVFCSARGGHVRELGYDPQIQSFRTGDLSLRSTHLFDDYELSDMCYSKAPIPVIWAVSTSGKLLGLTFVPEEQVGGWHQHETDGLFESCTSIPEGEEDSVYVVVQRNVNGAVKRFVEVFDTLENKSIETSFHLDCGLSADGTSSGSVGMTLTSAGSVWTAGATLTLTAASATFTVGTTDVGDQIWLYTLAGTPVKMTITSVTSTTVAQATCNVAIPQELRGATRVDWAWARDTFSGLAHLNGESVSVLADGVPLGLFPVSLGGVTISVPAVKVSIGLPYSAHVETLPASIQVDGYGQGRTKNISRSWLRLKNSYGLQIGPDEANLRPVNASVPLAAAEQRQTEALLDPSWQNDGVAVIKQDHPLPFTLIGMTLEASVGA